MLHEGSERRGKAQRMSLELWNIKSSAFAQFILVFLTHSCYDLCKHRNVKMSLVSSVSAMSVYTYIVLIFMHLYMSERFFLIFRDE